MLRKIILIAFVFFNFASVFTQGVDCELQWKRFSKDVDFNTTSGKALTEAINKNTNIITTWRILDEAGEYNLTTNIPELKYLDEYLISSQKTPENVIKDIESAGGYPKWKELADAGSDVLKQKFLTKIGKELPENWNKFSLENNIEFAERLKTFRGNSDLAFDPKLRGGEGQLFKSSLKDDLVMKRWFTSRVKDFPESIRLLKEADNLVKANSKLNKLIDVVSVGEKGSDWVIRGFNARSVPLKNMISDPLVAKVRQEAIDILTKQSGEISASILKKLNKNSANIHWSIVDQKLLIIDML